MNREQFEARVLDLWMTTRIPLTRAHIQYRTGVARKRMNGWLDELVADGVLEVDVDDDGEMTWQVPGAERPPGGARSFAELEGLEARGAARKKGQESRALVKRSRTPEDDVASLALSLARRDNQALERDPEAHRKSLLLSAGLSLFGPLGWLYAGSFKEAIPATLIALLLWKLPLIGALLTPLLFIALPVSAAVGALYAWQYNRAGHRTPLFLDDKNKKQG